MADVMQEFVRETMELMRKEWPIEKRLEGISVEDRLEGLSADELLEGLSAEQLREMQELLARKQKANGSPAQPE